MSNNFRNILLVFVFAAVLVIVGLSLWSAPERDAPPGFSGSSRLSELLGDDDTGGFRQATEPREFSFPADHGPHPEFRNEWWYVTGNLDSAAGRRFGYELTIFRFALTPQNDRTVDDASAWRSNQVYIAHFAVTDGANGAFHDAQRFSRGSLGLAGATVNPLRIWLGDWSMAAARSGAPGQFGRPWRLRASDGEYLLSLTLVPEKPPVLNGVDGLSQKAAAAGNASYYYSITRLATDGTLAIGDDVYAVSGLSWLDREWGSSALSDEQQGWDWFALQLSDGSDLMYYSLRRNDGSRDIHSAGTLALADGTAVHLSRDDLLIDALDTWESPLGGLYPLGWQITVPRFELALRIDPVLDAQELDTTVRYWEGAVDVSGTKAETALRGRGYVELTGYAGHEADPVDID